jgi:hypothetical protein
MNRRAEAEAEGDREGHDTRELQSIAEQPQEGAGGALFGVIGVILAVPVALSVKVALATTYGEPLRDEKDAEVSAMIRAKTLGL